MTIYLVYMGEYSDRALLGVFASLALAQAAAESAQGGWWRPHIHRWAEIPRYQDDYQERYWECDRRATGVFCSLFIEERPVVGAAPEGER